MALQQIIPILSDEDPEEKTDDHSEASHYSNDSLFHSVVLESADIQKDVESGASDNLAASEEKDTETAEDSDDLWDSRLPSNNSSEILITGKQSRLDELTVPEKAQWPLGRILAFGATFEEYQTLKERCLPELAPSLGYAVPYMKEHEEDNWQNRLDDAGWNAAMTLCDSIAKLQAEHQQGLAIARHKSMRMTDEEISRIMELSLIETLKKYRAYTQAVNILLNKHLSAFDFLYPHGVFDTEIAKAFFGSFALKRIQYCCDLDKFHQMRSSLQAKPVALKATLKEEASNKRTTVLNDWEHLKRYIEQQFDTQPFLGNIELDEKEYGLLIGYLEEMYERYKTEIGDQQYADKALCVGLVQIANRCSGVAYWPEVARAIGMHHYTDKMRKFFGQCFLYTMKTFRKATYTSSEFVDSIKLHTFVSNYGISRFFDFLYAYYDLDLGRNIDLADVEELRNLIISGNYFSRKQYILQQTIDALRLVPEVGLQRLKTYLHWIDDAYWTLGWKPDSEDRFACAFCSWCEQNEDFNGKWTIGNAARKHGKKMFSQPTLEMDRRRGILYLLLPVQKLPFQCDNEARWRILGKSEQTVSCEIIESVTCCTTDEKKIQLPMDELLDEMRLVFFCGSIEKKYTIQADCVRIFSEQGHLISGDHLTEGRTYFFSLPDEPIETEAEGSEQKMGPWLVSIRDLRNGETVLFPDHSLAIVGNEATEGLCGVSPAMDASVQDQEGTTYAIYPRLPHILLKTSEEQFALTRVWINDKSCQASSLKCQRFTPSERTKDIGYLLTLPNQTEEFAKYRVKIDVPGDGHSRKWQFCYWKNFSCVFMNGENPLPYWDAPRGSVSFNEEVLLNEKGLEKDPFANEYGFEIAPELSVLRLDIQHSDDQLVLQVPVCFWSVPGEAWKNQTYGNVWYKELPNDIDFLTTENEVTLFVDGDGLENEKGMRYVKKQGEESIHCDLLPIRHWLTHDRIKHTVYLRVGQKNYEFASVYCKSYFAAGRLEGNYQTNTLSGSFDIVGQGEYVVSILRNGKEIVSQIPLVNCCFEVQTALDSGNYTAIVYEAFEDEFGFDTLYDEIGREDTEILNPFDLTGACLYLKQVDTFCEKEVNLWLPEKHYKIEIQGKDEDKSSAYFGTMTAYDKSMVDLAVQVLFPNTHILDHCAVLFDDDGELQPFLYDYARKKIVQEEAPNLRRMERYRRYSVLEPQDTFTVVYDVR